MRKIKSRRSWTLIMKDPRLDICWTGRNAVGALEEGSCGGS